MSDEEYRGRSESILSAVPSEFRDALSHIAYEAGHGYGYHYVLSLLQDFVDALAEPIQEYGNSMFGFGQSSVIIQS